MEESSQSEQPAADDHSQSHCHIVVFPFMAHGHTIPMLHLSKALSRRGVEVTVITTPSNAPSLLPHIAKHPKVQLHQIPFPSSLGSCENSTANHLPAFLQASRGLQEPFDHLLRHLSEAGRLPTCVISDFFLGWTLSSCRAYGIPRLVFHGMGVLSMAISKTIWTTMPHLKASSDTDPLHMPNLDLPFTLSRADLSDMLSAPTHDDAFSKFVSETGEADVDSWGVIVNSFLEMESAHVASFEAFYRRRGAKAWCVGPLSLIDQEEEEEEEEEEECYYMRWMREQAVSSSSSVVYAAFGTQAQVSDEQLEEVAQGLRMSGYAFMLVVRSKTWKPQPQPNNNGGLIVSEWVDQRRILGHRAIGGFMSHCGWNSVMESLSAGVPILAWPMTADQPQNAKLVVDGLGAGVWMPNYYNNKTSVIIGRESIRDGVRKLMEGSSSLKERAQALSRAARHAVQEGGSSYHTITALLHNLRQPCRPL
ncbi:hypothetical protein Syun_010839 [Stephania yunnanensis]|uniref:Glycosyltransferase n=1 Tax=Stephania yunnanensis TaxID=152371 RepID=A0AAP0JX63_9MAGN